MNWVLFWTYLLQGLIVFAVLLLVVMVWTGMWIAVKGEKKNLGTEE